MRQLGESDARHKGTVHCESLTVVETHKEGGQLIVMNRNGSLVRYVEIHWYEAHGIGRRDFKIKRYLDE